MKKRSYIRKKTVKKKNQGLLSAKRKKYIAKKAQLLGFALVSVIISILVTSGVLIYKFVNAPFTKASYVDFNDSDKVWNDGQTTIIFGVLEDIDDEYSEIKELAVVNFDNESSGYNIFILPVEYNTEYSLNYGSGPLKRVYAVGNADDKRGALLLQRTLLKILAVNPDGYFFLDEDSVKKFETEIDKPNLTDLSALFRLKNLPKIPSMLNFVREESVTNMKIDDIRQFYGFVKNTSETSSYVVKIEPYQLDEEYRWDRIWRERHKFTELKAEGVKVFVANASESNTPNLAQWGGRVVENLGLELFSTKNSTTPLDQSTIITSDVNLETVKALKKALNIENIKDITDTDPSKYNAEVQRTNVSLFLAGF